MNIMKRYPRTKHLFGSGLQKGDEDLNIIPFSELKGKTLVCEEKIDGCNTGVSFDEAGELLLQSRGHYLVGGDWPEFDQFKLWGNTFASEFLDILEDRYIMYGEWMSAYHSVFYDALPHYFMEFDIYDKEKEVFLDTPSRHAFLSKCKANVSSVRVIEINKYKSIEELYNLVGLSAFISENAANELRALANKARLEISEIDILVKLNEDRIMEGLYIKWEEDGIVKGRYKYVRPDFVQTILDYGKHWVDRPTIPNGLAEGKDLFAYRS